MAETAKNDIVFKKLGLQGWFPFKEKFLEIWKLFLRYGNDILKVDLGESIDVYKKAFHKADGDEQEFITNLRRIWEERYHYVAKDFNHLIDLYEMAKEEGIKFNSLLPETNKKDSDNEGVNDIFSLSLSLYLKIEPDIITKREMYLYKEEDKLYKLSLDRGCYSSRYRKIEMTEVQMIRLK